MSWIAQDPSKYVGQPVGNEQCVAYVQAACGAPHTSRWTRGALVKGIGVPQGTAIATFDLDGTYGNHVDRRSHAAILHEELPEGLLVWDQWLHHPVAPRVIHFRGGAGAAVNDGDQFYVIVAHSMVGFVVQQAFTWAYQDVPPDWNVGQLIFASADVDQSVFSTGNFSAAMFAQHGGRLTAYCNRYDKALLVSNAKRLDLAPRMGRVGLPDDAPAMMCEVDCSELFEKVYPSLDADLSPVTTHSFYFDQPEFWRDVVLTLAGGIDRRMFPTRQPDRNNPIPNRFILDPAGIADDAYKTALIRSAVSPSIQPP